MLVKNYEKKDNKAFFQVEVNAEAFDKALSAAYKRVKGSIQVPGFRKGKVPRKVAEGLYGADVFHEEAVAELAPEAFDFAVKTEKIKNIGTPSLIDYNAEEDGGFIMSFSTELYPEVTLGQYKNLEAVYEEHEIGKKELEQEIEAVRKKNARYVEVERPVQNGDMIVLDFEGFVDGVAFEGGKAEDYSLEVGSGSFIPGFEEQLVGMNLDGEKDINVTFPENYGGDLAGKEAVFKVKIKVIRETRLPELDDDFAQDISEFDTMEEYSENLLKKIKEEAGKASDSHFKSGLLEKAVSNMQVDMPQALIQNTCEELLRDYASKLGIPPTTPREQIFMYLGLDESSFMNMMEAPARSKAKMELLLDKIVEVEELSVSEEELEESYKEMQEELKLDIETIKKEIDEELLRRDILRRNAANIIYDSGVKITPEEADAIESTEDEPESSESSED